MAKAKKKELSKGLGSLLGGFSDINAQIEKNPEKAPQILSNTVAAIPIHFIEVNPYNPRQDFEAGAMDKLVNSIKIHGLIQPITVRRMSAQQFQIISGERRFRASQIAGLKEVPAYVRLADDQSMMELALIENIERADLNPIEVAQTYSRLLDEFSMTQQQLSDRLNKTRTSITHSLGFLKLADAVQVMLKKGLITAGHARNLSGLNEIDQLDILQEIIDKKLSVRAVESLVSSWGNKKTSSGNTGLPHEYKEVSEKLKAFFGSGKVNIKVNAKGKGQIAIPFESTKRLNEILDLLDL